MQYSISREKDEETSIRKTNAINFSLWQWGVFTVSLNDRWTKNFLTADKTEDQKVNLMLQCTSTLN